MRTFLLLLIVFFSIQQNSYAVDVDQKIYAELGVKIYLI